MERDFNNFPPYMDSDFTDLYRDPMFNPMMQYEQAYSYYRCLCMQMDYKLKCKEYEKMCGTQSQKKIILKEDNYSKKQFFELIF